MDTPSQQKQGFTLVELAIALVVVGLIVGGIVIGQDMIKAAEIRATVTQINQYNSAVHAFQTQYNYLPGDISAAAVTRFGFPVAPSRAGTPGLGDGNGLIEGWSQGCNCADDTSEYGEPAWFWEDLNTNTSLISEGTFNYFGSTPPSGTLFFPATFLVFPAPKIGKGLYIYVYADKGVNFFAISALVSLDLDGQVRLHNGGPYISPGVTVAQAYAIDAKIDDGLPQSGSITAQYLEWDLGTGPVYAAGAGVAGPTGTTATPGSSTTCFDNGNVAGATQNYSVKQSKGVQPNCALSIQFQ